MIPLRVNTTFDRRVIDTSTGGQGGINLLTPPELSSKNFIQANEGYDIEASGRLKKLKGISEVFTVAGANSVTMLEEWGEDLWVYGYSNIVSAYDNTTDTSTVIKNDFTTTDSFVGQRYGGYFFVCNGGDKIGRITRTLDYDGQTGNFAVGLIVTGGTSGATGIILEDNDAGAAGTLTLGEISGVFQNDEALTDSATGVAVVDGTLGFTYTAISDAPNAKVLEIINATLYAANLTGDIVGAKKGNESTTVWAEIDDGSNPPFTNFTTSATPPEPDDPSSLRYRNAGAVNDIVPLGTQTITFSDRGKLGFHFETIDEATSGLAQNVIIDFQKQDLGGFRAVETPKGIFYVNESGLWRMLSGGNTSQPFSTNEAQVSRILGEVFVDDLDFSDADIVYIDQKSWVLVTCKKDNSFNDYILWYNIENGSFGTLPQYQINRFMKIDEVVYGASSIDTTVFKMFDEYENVGDTLCTLYNQEVPLPGGLDDTYDMRSFTIKGFLNPLSDIRIHFDVVDKYENLTTDYKVFSWTVGGGVKEVQGFNDAGFNDTSFNGGNGSEELVETRGYKDIRIHNFKRIKVRITSEDRVPHEVTYFMIDASNRGKNRVSRNIN